MLVFAQEQMVITVQVGQEDLSTSVHVLSVPLQPATSITA